MDGVVQRRAMLSLFVSSPSQSLFRYLFWMSRMDFSPESGVRGSSSGSGTEVCPLFNGEDDELWLQSSHFTLSACVSLWMSCMFISLRKDYQHLIYQYVHHCTSGCLARGVVHIHTTGVRNTVRKMTIIDSINQLFHQHLITFDITDKGNRVTYPGSCEWTIYLT